MKVVIPNYRESDSFVDNVAFTLEALGVEVATPSAKLGRSNSAAVTHARELWHRAYPQSWTAAERWVVAQVRKCVPDMVLCLTQVLREEVLCELRRLGVKRLVAWWGDTPANMTGLGLLASGWDRIFLKDAAAVAKFRAVGLEAELLHEAMNPAWHRRNFKTIGNDLVVAGNYYGYRQYLVGRLLDAGEDVSLYGPRPPKWADTRLKKVHTGRYVVKKEKGRVFGGGLACLNSTALSEGDTLNCRAFEIAGACGLQLIEDKPAVATCFEPGLEVLTYRSVEEISEHLARARCDVDWAMKIREAGHRRANADHTYEIRLRHILARAGFSMVAGERSKGSGLAS